MQKLKIFFLALLLFSLAFFGWKFTAMKQVVKKESLDVKSSLEPTSRESPKDAPLLDFELDGNPMRVIWIKVNNPEKIFLFPNFSQKLTSEEAFNKWECESLVSGGFYTINNSPTGLFITEGEAIKSWTKSALFNGIFSLNDNNDPQILPNGARDSSRIALQAGPLLYLNGEGQKLTLKSDEPARRVVIATTADNEVVFLIIYDPESVFLGPKLGDLAETLRIIGKNTDLEFRDALNLDGGTASTFRTESINLAELTPIGSYFCINE